MSSFLQPAKEATNIVAINILFMIEYLGVTSNEAQKKGRIKIRMAKLQPPLKVNSTSSGNYDQHHPLA
jgi:hypothetical protein